MASAIHQIVMSYPAAASQSALPAVGFDRATLWLFRVAVCVLLLNLFDGVLTLALVTSGLAEEANPVMAELIGRGAVQFMAYKMALVSLSILLCWRLRHARIACFAIYGTCATYSLLAIYHFKSIGALARYLS